MHQPIFQSSCVDFPLGNRSNRFFPTLEANVLHTPKCACSIGSFFYGLPDGHHVRKHRLQFHRLPTPFLALGTSLLRFRLNRLIGIVIKFVVVLRHQTLSNLPQKKTQQSHRTPHLLLNFLPKQIFLSILKYLPLYQHPCCTTN